MPAKIFRVDLPEPCALKFEAALKRRFSSVSSKIVRNSGGGGSQAAVSVMFETEENAEKEFSEFVDQFASENKLKRRGKSSS